MNKFLLSVICVMVCVLVGCDSHTPTYPSVDSSGGESSSKSYVVTGEAKDVMYNSAAVYGELQIELADYDSVAYGVLYSADKSELESRTAAKEWGADLLDDKYSVLLTGLQTETKYYYCAFVYLNGKQYKFGKIKDFTTLERGGIGVFSVSGSKQVTFSSGNLQYHPANKKWQFAETQLDYIGGANFNISSTYNGWIDLFGWSTKTTNFGVSTSTSSSDYSGSFVDWGANQIGNDNPNTWRTLTDDEWDYLRDSRPSASSLRGVAYVNGVNGLIFLPDNWICPAGVTFKSGFYSTYGIDSYEAYQTFTAEQWDKLEAAGAIFLPAGGFRHGSDVYYVQNFGNYWSATEGGSSYAWSFHFGSSEAKLNYDDRSYSRSVRLVKDLQ